MPLRRDVLDLEPVGKADILPPSPLIASVKDEMEPPVSWTSSFLDFFDEDSIETASLKIPLEFPKRS